LTIQFRSDIDFLLIKRSAGNTEKLENLHKYVRIFRDEEFYLPPDWRANRPRSLHLYDVKGSGTKRLAPPGAEQAMTVPMEVTTSLPENAKYQHLFPT
jgi:hypothetical protein